MRMRNLMLGAILMVVGTSGNAHEFTAGLLLTGPQASSRIAEVVNGFLLAADERDGHADETSDGHLGGVDVQVLPMPNDLSAYTVGLSGRPSKNPDVIVVFSEAGEPVPNLPSGALVVVAGVLPPSAVWQRGDFADRYLATYGKLPTQDAAQGYNEARRLDHAIRPLDGLVPTDQFASAIETTARGIDW